MHLSGKKEGDYGNMQGSMLEEEDIIVFNNRDRVV